MSTTSIEGYRDYLRNRDGEADLLNRRLENREQFFNHLETNPMHSSRPADRATFLRNLRHRKPEPGLDRKMLFLLATAKLNQAERFGVGLGETYGLNSNEDLPPERVGEIRRRPGRGAQRGECVGLHRRAAGGHGGGIRFGGDHGRGDGIDHRGLNPPLGRGRRQRQSCRCG